MCRRPSSDLWTLCAAHVALKFGRETNQPSAMEELFSKSVPVAVKSSDRDEGWGFGFWGEWRLVVERSCRPNRYETCGNFSKLYFMGGSRLSDSSTTEYIKVLNTCASHLIPTCVNSMSNHRWNKCDMLMHTPAMYWLSYPVVTVLL